jgi:hypothetical protein
LVNGNVNRKILGSIRARDALDAVRWLRVLPPPIPA